MFLTTHYMEEADTFATRGNHARGRIAAIGTPVELKARSEPSDPRRGVCPLRRCRIEIGGISVKIKNKTYGPSPG